MSAQQVRGGNSGGILSQFGCAPSLPLGIPSHWLTYFFTRLTLSHLLLPCCQYDSERDGLLRDDTLLAGVRLGHHQPRQGAAAPAQGLQTSSAARQERGQPSAAGPPSWSDQAVKQEGWRASFRLLRAHTAPPERE